MSDERRKLSWREIDKQKDQSGLSKLRKKRESTQRTEHGPLTEDKKKGYLKELERLFQDKQSKEREEASRKLIQAANKKEFKVLAKQFIERFGIPLDTMILIMLLDTKEKELILMVLEFVRENFSLFSREDLQALVSKLKTLRYVLTDPKVLFQVERVLKEVPL